MVIVCSLDKLSEFRGKGDKRGGLMTFDTLVFWKIERLLVIEDETTEELNVSCFSQGLEKLKLFDIQDIIANDWVCN